MLNKEIAFSLKEMSGEQIIKNQDSELYQVLYLEISHLTQATLDTLEILSNIYSQKLSIKISLFYLI